MWHSEVGSKRKGVSPGIGHQESFLGRQLSGRGLPTHVGRAKEEKLHTVTWGHLGPGASL